MPKTHRSKPLYERGGYRLFRWEGRKNLVVVSYDPAKRRERITSTGSPDVEVSSRFLDSLYVRETQGANICPECGQIRPSQKAALVTDVISDYLIAHAEDRHSSDAIRHRLAHVVSYIEAHPRMKIPRCDEVDERWVDTFRKWFIAQPIVTPSGREKQRSLSTVENSVLQLAAAINFGFSKGQTPARAKFRARQPQDVNRTPEFRASMDELKAMFGYALATTAQGKPSGRRLNLLRFLRISFATLARPDAAHDVSTDPERRQWNSKAKILHLNPKGRAQTAKFRAVVPVIDPVAEDLDRVQGYYIPINSVKSAFETMVTELDFPRDGESGMKLIRRSVANILRSRLPTSTWSEISVFMGHDQIASTTDLYAPLRPDYLVNVKAELQRMADEIEVAVPGAFYHSFTTSDATRRAA